MLQSPQKEMDIATRFTIPRHPMGVTSSGSPYATGFAACCGQLQHAVQRLTHFKLTELRIVSSAQLRTLWVLAECIPHTIATLAISKTICTKKISD